MNQPVIYDYIGESYPRGRREAHRRRATLISPPSASLSICINRPGRWNLTFRPFLHAILGQLNEAEVGSPGHAEVERRLDAFISNAVRHYDISSTTSDPGGSADLTCELRDRDLERGIWRIEVLREYVALTLHVGIELGRDSTNYLVTLKGRSDDPVHGVSGRSDKVFSCALDRSGSANRAAAVGLNTILFDNLVKELERRFDPVMLAVADTYPGDLSDRSRLKDQVFAVMYAVAAPWTILPDADPSPDCRPGVSLVEPVFPEFDAPGLEPEERAAAQQKTNRFLTQHWGVLKGSLLSNTESDCVACYMQSGHLLYVSSLGSETSDPKEPIKYLLLYRDPGTPPDGERGVSHTASCNFAWRISRFISRVHDMGAARLRALSHHEEISRFLIHAKDIEFNLAERRLDRKVLLDIEQKFRRVTHADTEDVPEGEKHRPDEQDGIVPGTMPLMVRASIVKSQYGIMMRLAQDLQIVPLPGYQAYDQFLRRRVIGPLEWMLSAPERYESIAQKLNTASLRLQREAGIEHTLAIRDQSDEIRRFQRIADTIGKVILVYYSMQGTYYVLHHLEKSGRLAVWFDLSIPEWLIDAVAAGAAGLAIVTLIAFSLFGGNPKKR